MTALRSYSNLIEALLVSVTACKMFFIDLRKTFENVAEVKERFFGDFLKAYLTNIERESLFVAIIFGYKK